MFLGSAVVLKLPFHLFASKAVASSCAQPPSDLFFAPEFGEPTEDTLYFQNVFDNALWATGTSEAWTQHQREYRFEEYRKV